MKSKNSFNSDLESKAILFLVIIFIILSLLVLKGVFFIIAYSILLAYLLFPLYKYIKSKNINDKFSSLLTLGSFMFVIFLPVLLLLYYIVIRLVKFLANYRYLIENPNLINHKISSFLTNTFSININLDLSNLFLDIIKYLTNLISEFFYSIPVIIMYFFIVLFLTYYILINNEKIKKSLFFYLPIEKNKVNFILNNMKTSIDVLFRGYFLTALAQTFVAFLIYVLLKVPNILIITFLTFIFSLVPYVGTGVVWVPLSLYLYLSGNEIGGVILFLYGSLIISSIDNFLRPILMSKEGSLSPPFVFIGFLGGLSLLGPPGLILGPLILSTTISLLRLIKIGE